MLTLVVATVLPWVLIAVGAWLLYQLVRQNGRILLRLEAIEQQLGPRTGKKQREAANSPTGLALGTESPDFELSDLAGVRRKLSEFRGKDVLLVFFNPKCGFCTKMAADLAALPAEGGEGRAVPVVVTTGDAGENRKLVERYGIRCLVLLQKEMEIASQFRAPGTPMGYRIDGKGRIASELVVGAEPLLKLAQSSQHTPCADKSAYGVSGLHKDDPSLARSKINRNGLKAGSVAPEVRLPRIDGGELSLADFRGRRVLLVFSDPNCGPCDELAPELERIHCQRTDLQVLVVSRRDAEATRAKAAKLGLSFPIVLQKQWEISLLYGKFATPIAYLIDEQGVLLSDVAVGVEPILAIADDSPSAAAVEPYLNGKEAALTT